MIGAGEGDHRGPVVPRAAGDEMPALPVARQETQGRHVQGSGFRVQLRRVEHPVEIGVAREGAELGQGNREAGVGGPQKDPGMIGLDLGNRRDQFGCAGTAAHGPKADDTQDQTNTEAHASDLLTVASRYRQRRPAASDIERQVSRPVRQSTIRRIRGRETAFRHNAHLSRLRRWLMAVALGEDRKCRLDKGCAFHGLFRGNRPITFLMPRISWLRAVAFRTAASAGRLRSWAIAASESRCGDSRHGASAGASGSPSVAACYWSAPAKRRRSGPGRRATSRSSRGCRRGWFGRRSPPTSRGAVRDRATTRGDRGAPRGDCTTRRSGNAGIVC